MLFNKFIRKLLNCVYGFVMLMPLIAVVVLCLYAIFNKNATLTNDSLDNVFYFATNQVLDSSLFNWSLNSFLVAPIDYFLNLFSVPTQSFYTCLLSYWLSISLGWIGFEILMWFITFARSLINDFNVGGGF